MAQIIARDLNVNCLETSGALVTEPRNLNALLTNLESRDVLFIDDIHRLNPEERGRLYQAMKDFRESATACRTNGIFRENFRQSVRELTIKC